MSEESRELKPKLRPVEAIPAEAEGRKMLCLRDPLGVAEGIAVFELSPFTLFLLRHFDGKHTLGDIQLKFLREFGEMIQTDHIAEFVHGLDENGFLDSDNFRDRRNRARREYLAAPERPCTMMDGPDEKLREELMAQFKRDREHSLGPADARLAGVEGALLGVFAPHIDYMRGGFAYAWAYGALAQGTSARTFVILGTVHHPMCVPFAATRKPFASPFGRMEIDAEFLEALQARCPGLDLLGDEFAHSAEHSIELQTLYLQGALRGRAGEEAIGGKAIGNEAIGNRAMDAAKPADWRIVPILVDSCEEDVRAKRSPSERAEVREFVAGLRGLLEERGDSVCLIAGVDFSHVGPRFGAQRPLTSPDLEEVARKDQEMIHAIEQVDAEGFARTFFEDGNSLNVCSIAPIYCALSVLAGRARGKSLCYGQAVDPDRNGAVTFGGMAFLKDGGAS